MCIPSTSRLGPANWKFGHQRRRRQSAVFSRGRGRELDTDFVALRSDVVTDRLDAVDHISQSMPYDEMLSWLLFYTGILDLERLPQMEIADPVGLVQSQALINSNQGLRMILNGSSATRTLSARFINEFFGSGVQHIAFSCSDIFAAVADMRAHGADFLKIPDNYYDDIEAKYDLDAKRWQPFATTRFYTTAKVRANSSRSTRIRSMSGFSSRSSSAATTRVRAGNAAVRLAAQTRESRR